MRSNESRSNEYNFGSQSSMESVGRSSRPQSRSMIPSQPPSTGKRTASQSRLPMPGMKGKGPTANKRSSSSGAHMQERNQNRQMTTPTTRSTISGQPNRANSGTRPSKRESCITPQRYQGSQSNRKSYSNSKVTATGTKISMGGQRLSGRGSAIGAKGCKDTRPLTDKSYQQSQVRKILDFLRKNNYTNNALTSKHFPLSSKEFVSVFNFLYSFLQPDNLTVLPYTRFEESILPLLKSLAYPGNLSKSNFLTLGSMHSWPTVLGSLAFLCDMAIIYAEKLSPNIIPIGFVNKDEQGFSLDTESEEKITFFHFMDCFQEFNDGADEFPEQLKNLEDNLMENLGVNVDNMQYMQQKEIGLRNQLAQLESNPNKKVALMEQCQNLDSDKEKLVSYNNNMDTYLKKVANEQELQLRIEKELALKVQVLEGEIQELRQICKSGSVPSLEAERSSVMVADYRRQVEQARNDGEEVDKEIFQQEIKISRAREGLEGIAKQFNGLSVEESIGGEQPILLSVPVFRGRELIEEEDNARLKPDLAELLKSRRAATRNTERELQAEVAKAEQLEDVLRWIIFRRLFFPFGTSLLFRGIVKRIIKIISGFGLSINGQHVYCGDYIFSGHTMVLTMGYYAIRDYSPRRFRPLHLLSLVTSVAGVVFLLMARGHYSIDVVLAYWITSWHWRTWHSMANNEALWREGDHNLFSEHWWWFAFVYFEPKVPGPLPRVYNLPIPEVILNKLPENWRREYSFE